jgi:probable HAF family extracellular repeat protein
VVVALPGYSVVPILPPSFEGALGTSSGFSLNEIGQVLGSYRVEDSIGQYGRAFVYADGLGSIDLPSPASWSVTAAGINNGGQIAMYGAERGGDGQLRAYRYSATIGFEPLGTFGGTQTEAAGINNSGQVTGFSETADGRSHAYRYTDGGGLQDINTGFTSSRGYAINDGGWAAGRADGNAVIFRDEGNVVLLPGIARGINDAGNVVGNTSIVPGHPTAFIYRNGQMLILGDDVFSQPILYDINNQNVAVGSGGGTALLWSYSETSSGLVDLNTLVTGNSGWTLLTARGINDSGQITGWGFFNGEFIAFRLDPVPEPAAWLLFGLGGALVWRVRRRRYALG